MPGEYADLGLKNPEELLAKAEIVQRISDIIAERKLNQATAAKLLGIDQPKVSALRELAGTRGSPRTKHCLCRAGLRSRKEDFAAGFLRWEP